MADHYKIVFGGPGTEVITNESYDYKNYEIGEPIGEMFTIRARVTGTIVLMIPLRYLMYVETIIEK